jgi:hypothetical protein
MLAVCGGHGCKRIFEIKGVGKPAVFICPTCEEKINKGIQIFLHTYTERPTGNFNLMEKLNGTIRLQ